MAAVVVVDDCSGSRTPTACRTPSARLAVSSASSSPLSFSRSTIKVGTVPIDYYADYDVFLTNVGTEPLTVVGGEITPDSPNTYMSVGACLEAGSIPRTLNVGETCLFEVNVGTHEVGTLNGKWCITATGATATYRKCGRIVGKVVT
jgi:hypothetical protein